MFLSRADEKILPNRYAVKTAEDNKTVLDMDLEADKV